MLGFGQGVPASAIPPQAAVGTLWSGEDTGLCTRTHARTLEEPWEHSPPKALGLQEIQFHRLCNCWVPR